MIALPACRQDTISIEAHRNTIEDWQKVRKDALLIEFYHEVELAGEWLARVFPSHGSSERPNWSKRGPQGNAPSKFRRKVELTG
jgi:hypothetical protein